MNQGIEDCEEKGKIYHLRHIHPDLWKEFLEIEDKARYPEKYIDILK
jgi:hypothetical protein